MPDALRMNSDTSKCRSMAAIACVTADCVKCIFTAAELMLPLATTS
jgi:hypothetical protein